MPETITVIPVAGRKVRNPATGQPIPAEGIQVEKSAFWTRRINDGDVTVAPAKAKTRAKASKE